jgi:hypothetical protein
LRDVGDLLQAICRADQSCRDFVGFTLRRGHIFSINRFSQAG